MPGSLLPTVRGVTRNESTRSDSSAASNTSQGSATGNKKVSFNKAVRVKKYPRPRRSEDSREDPAADDRETPSKRFWFRVYKNKHRQDPDPSEFSRARNEVIYYGNDEASAGNGFLVSYHPDPSPTAECATQTTPGRKSGLLGNETTPLHPSQMPSDPPQVKRNHVRKIVSRFNEEAVLQRQLSSEGEPVLSSPPGSPRLHSTPKHHHHHHNIPAPPPPPPPVLPPGYDTSRPPPPEGLFSTSRLKKNPIVNGVKVMFGMGQAKKGERGDSYGDDHALSNGDYKSHVDRDLYRDGVFADESETFVKSPYSPSDTFLYGDSKAIVRRDKYDVSHKNGYHDDEDDGYDHYYDDGERKGKYHFETWDSGNQLVFDTTDVNTSTSKTDKGEFTSTVGEKHQLWQNNKRIIVFEEPSPTIIRRKAKSHTDLSNAGDKHHHHEDKIDKGISTEDLHIRKHDKGDTLSKRSKDWLRSLKSSVRDKGVQCSKIPTDEPEELYGFGRYKIIRPRNGVVSAFSNVPPIDKPRQDSHQTAHSSENGYSKDSVIYSQVDKSKKKRNGEKDKKKGIFSEEGKLGGLFKARSEPLFIGPPPKSQQQQHIEDELESNYFEDRGERVVKTSRKGFGFKLNVGKDSSNRSSYRSSYEEQDWYDIDGDIEASQRNRRNRTNHRDISEVRQELAVEEETDVSSLSNGEQHKRNGNGAGSVIREVDYKKREISYENVPRSDGENNNVDQPVGSGLWYREADEDYRREMAQSEVSYPAGNSVGSDRFYTVDRRDKSSKKLPPPSPRAYTLDRRHLKTKDKQKQAPANTSGVKIMVNGKELKDKASAKKGRKRDDPSSVQSDPLFVRGGLAAAYQARQRANIRRSNSTASGLSSKYRGGGSSPNVRRIIAGSSEMSAASSESESGKTRRPLVMYIPGVSHTEKASDAEDRVSSTIARSHSMMAPARPPRVSKKGSQKSAPKGTRPDPYRNGDIFEEEDEIMPLASDYNRKKPPKVPHDPRKQSDIKRRHSMPKDTKFSWLKWRLRGKPSREP